jgi:hypothetical protein
MDDLGTYYGIGYGIGLIVWGITFAVLCGIVASAKGRSTGSWVIAGLIFGIFAFVAVCVVPSRRHQEVVYYDPPQPTRPAPAPQTINVNVTVGANGTSTSTTTSADGERTYTQSEVREMLKAALAATPATVVSALPDRICRYCGKPDANKVSSLTGKAYHIDCYQQALREGTA